MDEFINILPEEPESSMVSLTSLTSGSGSIFDLFTRWKYNTTPVYLELLLANAWKESPEKTLKLIVHCRNCRKNKSGRGLRDQFYMAVDWLVKSHRDCLLPLIRKIPEFGYWKDLWNLWGRVDELSRASIVIIVSNQLKADAHAYITGRGAISLCAKWAPSISRGFDRQYGLVTILCKQLGWTKREYKQNIKLLRDKLSVTERLVCQQRISDINFYSIPNKSRRIHNSSFVKWCLNNSDISHEYTRYLLDPKCPLDSTDTHSHSTWELLLWIITEYITVGLEESEDLENLWNGATLSLISDMLSAVHDIDTTPAQLVVLQSGGWATERARLMAITVSAVITERNNGLIICNGKEHQLNLDTSIYERIVVLDELTCSPDKDSTIESGIKLALNRSPHTTILTDTTWTKFFETSSTEFVEILLSLSNTSFPRPFSDTVGNIDTTVTTETTETIDTIKLAHSIDENETDANDVLPLMAIKSIRHNCIYWNLSNLCENQSLELIPNPIAPNIDLLVVNGISQLAIEKYFIMGELNPSVILQELLNSE